MVSATECGLPEAALQRACGSLYVTHGLESTCGLVMYVFFSVVAVKIHCRGHLRSPALAFIRFIFFHIYEFVDEFITTLYTVGQMGQMKLEARLRFCTTMDKMANAVSAILSLLGVTRWLSIGNINGMRYIGYALTCPLTQVELVVMLAPIIPCYRFFAFLGFAITSCSLTCAYVASLLYMPVWEGDLITYIQTKNIDDFAPTPKFYVVFPALCGIATLWVCVLPYLMAMYTFHGGNRNIDLPPQYRFLVSLVWCTWLCFPIWWFMSWEGNAVIEDTKINEIGFTILNMIAKGLFTLQSFRVGEINDARTAARRGGNKASRRSKDDGGRTLATQPTGWSSEGERVPPILSRASSRKLSSSKFVQILRMYDQEDEESESESGTDTDDDRLHRAAKGRDQPPQVEGRTPRKPGGRQNSAGNRH